MNKNTSFFMSLKNAAEGVYNAFLTEANLRFHFVVANLIVIFAYFFGITKIEWAILVFTIALVFFAEFVNTAIENAVDTATKEFSKTAKIAKDVAAGAVLVSAIFAVVIGFILFFDTAKISRTLIHIFTTPKILIPCLIVGILDLIFLIFFKKRKK